MWTRLILPAVVAALITGSAHAAASTFEQVVNVTRASSIFTTLAPCPPADVPSRPILHKPRPRAKPRVRIIPVVQSPVVRPEGVGAPAKPIVHHRRRPMRAGAAAGFKAPQFLAAAVHRPGRCETMGRDGKRPLLMSALSPDTPPDDAGAAPGAASPDAAPADGSAPIEVAPKIAQSSPFFGFPGGSGGGAPGGFAGGGGGGGGPPNTPTSSSPPPTPPTPISDVPEPGVWALLLSGFTAIGLALRASRRGGVRRVV